MVSQSLVAQAVDRCISLHMKLVPLGQSKLRLATEQLAGIRIGFQRADESREVAVCVRIVVPQHHIIAQSARMSAHRYSYVSLARNQPHRRC